MLGAVWCFGEENVFMNFQLTDSEIRQQDCPYLQLLLLAGTLKA